MLRELSARHFWGLSGTPNLSSAAKVAEMASLLQIFTEPTRPEDAQATARWN